MSVVDAHQHLWDPAGGEYGWMCGPGLGPLRRAFTVGDLRAAIAGTPVERTVLVQAAPRLDEARGLLATAAASGGLIAGVVGWVDLTGDAGREIAGLRAGPGGELLVGIRHQAEDEADPGWLMRGDVRQGLAAVARAGLVFDLLVRPPQLAAAAAVAATLPELQFVLDHGGKPPVAGGDPGRWRADVAGLAAAPNVACKLSGLVTEADWARWREEDVLPYAAHLLASFGAERMMFGSDWPVCTLAAGYAEVLGLTRRCVEALAPNERDAVLEGTATRIYGLARSDV